MVEVQRQTKREAFFWAIREVCKTIWRTSLVIIVLILVSLGACDVYEFFCPEKVPEVSYIGRLSPEYINARTNSTRHFVNKTELDPEECWQSIQPTLIILHKVCPQASEWFKDRYEKDKITWESKESSKYLAKYNYTTKHVLMNRAFLQENDGTKASLIAHEYRHSLQSFAKPYKAIVAMMLTREYSPGIIENDAYLFEKQVYLSIFD